jgi:uncharacterized protein YdeI (YjbR/CyaY-like superfamily)
MSARADASPPATFRTAAAFRTWLRRHHRSASEIVVRCVRTEAADRGITYAQALDEALCFGWIDGVRRSVDARSFSVRFSPRRPRSTWSRVNVAHAERLIAEGRMTPAGLAAFEARDDRRTGVYSFEQPPTALDPVLQRRFEANPAAWAGFQRQPPGYRRVATYWVMSAKREETRVRRLDTLIGCSAEGKRIPPLDRAR